MSNKINCAQDLVNIIKGATGQEQIDEAHEKLQDTIKDMPREQLEGLCIRMAYTIDIMQEG